MARVGLVGVPCPCGAGRTCRGFGAFGTFEAWQMAALNAYKRSHCCGRGVPFPCGVGQTFGGVGRFGGFEASQTAAYKRSHCCGRGVLLSHCGGLVVAFACSVGKEAIAAAVGCLFPAELGKLLEELEGLEGLRLRKRQPIKEAIAAAVGCS